VDEKMSRLLLGFLLAGTVQVGIFAGLGINQHERFISSAGRHDSAEHFYCLELRRTYTSEWQESSGVKDCYSPEQEYVSLTNFPVFAFTVPLVKAYGSELGISEVLLFYLLNSIGILLFWCGLGILLDDLLHPRQTASLGRTIVLCTGSILFATAAGILLPTTLLMLVFRGNDAPGGGFLLFGVWLIGGVFGLTAGCARAVVIWQRKPQLPQLL
jgi:hypothetical protein